MAADWRNLDETKRSEFAQLADDDKARYERELDEYKSQIYKTNVGSSA